MRWFICSSVAWVTVACGAASAPLTPVGVVEAQAEALRRGDLMAAHRHLTPRAQAIAPQWPATPLSSEPLRAAEVTRRAQWTGEGEPLVVERGSEGWRLRGGVLALMRADTPEEALASFATALLSRDYAALLRLVPESERVGWSVERLHEVFEDPRVRPSWLALAQALRTEAVALSWLDQVRVRARVGEVTVVLVREPTGWKLFDVSPASDYTRP